MSLINEHLTRQSDLIPEESLGESITIIGAGAIGSWVALNLTKMGLSNITLIDFDIVEIVNLNAQVYGWPHIGKPKVEALADMVENLTRIRLAARQMKYEGQPTYPGIVISAVDSMAVRRTIWEAHKNSVVTRAVIDPRMSAEHALLYVVKPGNEKYAKTLYSDSEAMIEPCTARATGYTACMLSGLVCKAVKDLITKGETFKSAMWNITDDELVIHK